MSIHLGDCMDGMKSLADNSIDVVITDPPYFLDGLCNNWSKEGIDKKGSSKCISNLPKGMKFDKKQTIKFREFYTNFSKEVFRVLKPGGAFLSFSSPRLYHALGTAVDEAGFEIRDMMGWIYTQSQVKSFSQDHIIQNDKKMSQEQKDDLKMFCRNWKTPQLKPAIEPICIAVKPIEGRYIDNFAKYGVGLVNFGEETKVGTKTITPSNIVTTENITEDLDKVFLVDKPNKAEKGEGNTHLSVKPVKLIEHLIKLFTREGALVMDPFMGSGTTAVAANNTGRGYIGWETNEEYHTIAMSRTQP